MSHVLKGMGGQYKWSNCGGSLSLCVLQKGSKYAPIPHWKEMQLCKHKVEPW